MAGIRKTQEPSWKLSVPCVPSGLLERTESRTYVRINLIKALQSKVQGVCTKFLSASKYINIMLRVHCTDCSWP